MQANQFEFFYGAKNKIQHLLAPLQKLAKVDYFAYGVNYAHSTFSLSTHPGYFADCIEKDFPMLGYELPQGWHSWERVLSDEHRTLAHSHDSGNGIMLLIAHPHKTEIIEFASTPGNREVFDFYLSHQDLLKKFIAYFRREAKDLIQAAHARQIAYSPKSAESRSVQLPSEKLNAQDFIRHLAESSFGSLSKRERECYGMLVKGYSMAEIGEELSLAIPTVANYIARVKQKLACDNKKDLVAKGKQAHLIEYHLS